MLRFFLFLVFITAACLYGSWHFPNGSNSTLVIFTIIIGAYMAVNIGANDVANTAGPVVGSQAMILPAAILVAVIFEIAGAFLASGEVVSTMRKEIIDIHWFEDNSTIITVMLSGLLAGAFWINLCTLLTLPISTTHSVVGGLLGASIAAKGWDIANWTNVLPMAVSWIIAPLAGGVIAATLLYLLKRTITYRAHKLNAARQQIPFMVGIIGGLFFLYLGQLQIRGLPHLDKQSLVLGSLAAATAVFLLAHMFIHRAIQLMQNKKSDLDSLFTLPVIFAAALLGFSHGANDVANAVGPVAAIFEAISQDRLSSFTRVPMWILAIGAFGIAVGLAIYGPRMIRAVGTQITEIDRLRAFCISSGAAITLLIASQLGIPISTTHVVIGGIFGIGLLREHLKANYAKAIAKIRDSRAGEDELTTEYFLNAFQHAALEQKRLMLKQLDTQDDKVRLSGKEANRLQKAFREELVKRSLMLRILTAWALTIPLTGIAGALFYLVGKALA